MTVTSHPHPHSYPHPHTPFDRWEPATPTEVAALFAPAATAAPWWVAGGYAIELAAGRRLRAHADIDVLLLRRDQLAVQRALPGWHWWAADPPGQLRPWRSGETLPRSVRDIWCQRGPGEPWRVQIMLAEADGAMWVFHRDPRVRLPIRELSAVSGEGVPHLVPQVQLLHKAAAPRVKDEIDFAAALPLLGPAARRWLRDAISLVYGSHSWADLLR